MNSQKIDKVDDVVLQASSSSNPPGKLPHTTTSKAAVKKSESKAVEASEAKVKGATVAKESKSKKKLKLKVVRDSFTMPESEHRKIAEIKEVCLKSGMLVKKSEVLRAGLIVLRAMDEEQLKSALSSLDKIKTGRPNKH